MDFIIQNAIKKSKSLDINVDKAMIGQANIQMIGVGGGGCNIADWLHNEGVKGAEVISVNTDKQHLDIRNADKKLLIGEDTCRGLGCGGFPEVGEQAARESKKELKAAIGNADMVFICTGLGGGTGSGAAPVIAEIAAENDAIVIGAVTMPFNSERARIEKAEESLAKLRQVCDSVIVIDNNRLVEIAGNLPLQQAFAVANGLIATMIKGIVETIAVPSLVNIDFADVKAIMKNGGVSAIGIGDSDSENKVDEAVRRAMMNPLIDVDYKGASGAIIHVSGGNDMTLDDVNRVGELVTHHLDANAQVILGARIRDDMNGKISVMTIVSGVNSPYILGRTDQATATRYATEVSDELGIEILK